MTMINIGQFPKINSEA